MLKTLAIAAALGTCAFSADPDGAELYLKSCASCHDAGVPRAPNRDTMKRMAPESILAALRTGSMRTQSSLLTRAEQRAVSEFAAGKVLGSEAKSEAAEAPICSGRVADFKSPFAGPHWNGWGVDAANSRSQSSEMAGLSAADVPRLKVKWAFAFPGDIRSNAQPAVAGGRLFAGSAGRRVYSLSAATGCTYWVFQADFPVRTAISIGPGGSPGRYAIYFGDRQANAYAVDAASGELLWKTRVEDHPAATITGAPRLHDGRLFVPVSSGEEVSGGASHYECCRFRGSVVALDASNGKQIWKSYTIQEAPRPIRRNAKGVQLWGPSGAGIWSSPTLDLKRRAIYVTTGDSYSDPAAATSDAFLAFDMDNGKLLWSSQMTAGDAFNLACGRPDSSNCPEAKGPDFDFGSSPILVTLEGGRRALVAGQKSGMVHAVDPDQRGEIIWQTRVGRGGVLGGIQWGQAADRDNVYVALSDVGFRTPDPSSPKSVLGSRVALDPKSGGGLFALRLATGEKVWHAPSPGCGSGKAGCSPAQSAAVTLIPGVVFSGSLDGHLRAYSTGDGRILWDVDTARDYTAVNSVPASGGSLDGPGPVVVGGILYVNSGYGAWGGIPGNVLLAFSVDGK